MHFMLLIGCIWVNLIFFSPPIFLADLSMYYIDQHIKCAVILNWLILFLFFNKMSESNFVLFFERACAYCTDKNVYSARMVSWDVYPNEKICCCRDLCSANKKVPLFIWGKFCNQVCSQFAYFGEDWLGANLISLL